MCIRDSDNPPCYRSLTLFLRLFHGEGRVGTTSRLTVQPILRVDRVEPFAPAPFWTFFFVASSISDTENWHAQNKAFSLKHKQVG